MHEFAEKPVLFECRGSTLQGILHRARIARRAPGVLIIVGGPQYRVGSHRQFLYLARRLATAGYPVFRFDIRGMGDSGGEQVMFEESAPDIMAALGAFRAEERDLEGVVLWGLCDAASAILMHGVADRDVRGAVLLNPWVRSDATLAGARIANYYGNRISSPDFWKKLLSGKVDIWVSIQGFLADWRKNAARRWLSRKRVERSESSGTSSADFRERMLAGFEHHRKPVLLILSGSDLTAGEFVELCRADQRWERQLSRDGVMIKRLEGADHTFSSADWRGTVENWTLNWLDGFADEQTVPVSVSNEKNELVQ